MGGIKGWGGRTLRSPACKVEVDLDEGEDHLEGQHLKGLKSRGLDEMPRMRDPLDRCEEQPKRG